MRSQRLFIVFESDRQSQVS